MSQAGTGLAKEILIVVKASADIVTFVRLVFSQFREASYTLVTCLPASQSPDLPVGLSYTWQFPHFREWRKMEYFTNTPKGMKDFFQWEVPFTESYPKTLRTHAYLSYGEHNLLHCLYDSRTFTMPFCFDSFAYLDASDPFSLWCHFPIPASHPPGSSGLNSSSDLL